MKLRTMVVLVASIIGLSTHVNAQWQLLAGKLVEKGLETTLTVLLSKGIENYFGADGKPDLSSLDARLRAAEQIIGPYARPLTDVRATINTDTTYLTYRDRVVTALLQIDEALKRNTEEAKRVNERAARVELQVQDLDVRLTVGEANIDDLKRRITALEQSAKKDFDPREFLRAWVESARYPSDELMFYDDHVNYFQYSNVDRNFIEKDRVNYRNRWPIREYRLRKIENYWEGRDRIEATLLIDYTVQNGNVKREGSVVDSVKARLVDGQYRIYSVTERKK